jgi:3-oxoacyl-[acyl-carrier protein] reductase
MRLQDTTVVVTGASSGLGKEMAAAFIEAGANVVCAARSMDRLERLVDEHDGTATTVRCDVRSEADVESLFQTTEDQYGGLDLLINNAGIQESHVADQKEVAVESLTVDAWDAIMETNLRGVFLCTRAALPLLRRSEGRVVHLTSGMGQEGRAGRAAYATSKFGVEGFHQSVTAELADTGVESILLDPGGGVDTEGFSQYIDEDKRADRLDPSIIVEPALRLAEGYGENGGRYVAADVDNW